MTLRASVSSLSRQIVDDNVDQGAIAASLMQIDVSMKCLRVVADKGVTAIKRAIDDCTI